MRPVSSTRSPRTAVETRSAELAAVGYIIDDMWTVRGTLDVRYVTANDYATNDRALRRRPLQDRDGPRDATWTYSRTLAMDASVRWFYLDAERSPIFPPGANINGVHADHARDVPFLEGSGTPRGHHGEGWGDPWTLRRSWT